MKKDLTVHMVTAFIPFLFSGCGKNVHSLHKQKCSSL